MTDLAVGLLMLALGVSFATDAIREYRRARTFRHRPNTLTGRLDRLADIGATHGLPTVHTVPRRTRRLQGYRVADLVLVAIPASAAAFCLGFGAWLVFGR